MDVGFGVSLDLDRYTPLILPIFIALAAKPLSERLPPRAATWLLTVTSLVLTVVCAANLIVLAVGGAIRIPQVASRGHLSLPIIRHSGDTSVPVAALAGLALAVALLAAVRAAGRQIRAFRSAAATARALPGQDRVTVVEDAVPDAFALPGRPGRIVVSTGMLEVLDGAERKALLAHERSHLDDRHYFFRTAVQVAAAANPLMRPVRRAVIYTTERWADERAASATGDRKVAARAIGKAALAGRAASRHHSAGEHPHGLESALGRSGTTVLNVGGGSSPGPVPRRVAALLAPPPHRKAGQLTAAFVAFVVLLSVASGFGEATDLHRLVEHAQVSTGHHR